MSDSTPWHFPFVWEIREGGLFELLRIFGLRMVTHSIFRGIAERALNNKQRTLARKQSERLQEIPSNLRI